MSPRISSRTEYLSIDKELIKRHRGTVPCIDYFLRKSSQVELCPLNQKFPIALCFGNSRYSVDKIANKLNLNKWGKLDFNLDDPYFRRSRVPVTYYRLHDPALRSYFGKKAVKNRMIDTNQLTKDGDAIISRKEFFEISRYLEMRRSGQFLREESERVRFSDVSIVPLHQIYYMKILSLGKKLE